MLSNIIKAKIKIFLIEKNIKKIKCANVKKWQDKNFLHAKLFFERLVLIMLIIPGFVMLRKSTGLLMQKIYQILTSNAQAFALGVMTKLLTKHKHKH